MVRSYQLEVNEQGALTLPEELRDSLGLQSGDRLTLMQGTDALLVIPTRLIMPEIAERLSELMQQKGLTPADMLAGLDAEGERLFTEEYGQLTSS